MSPAAANLRRTPARGRDSASAARLLSLVTVLVVLVGFLVIRSTGPAGPTVLETTQASTPTLPPAPAPEPAEPSGILVEPTETPFEAGPIAPEQGDAAERSVTAQRRPPIRN